MSNTAQQTTYPTRLWTWFTPADFADRRSALYDLIGDGVAVLQGAGPLRGFELFRQTNEALYLAGLEAPQAYLLLDGATRTTAAYLPNRPARETADDTVRYVEDADRICALTGLDAVHPWSALEQHLSGRSVIFTPFQPAEGRMTSRDVLAHAARLEAADPWDGAGTRQDHFIALLRERVHGAELRDLSPLLDRLRSRKSALEVDVMRHAGELSAQAVIAAMRLTKPGLRESDLYAAMHRVFIEGGARSEGYRAIIPAGLENTWDGHYCKNDGPLVPGDLILMDCAPDICNYTSDIGRMWPVNGRYTGDQRALYGLVVSHHIALMKQIRPGVLPRQAMLDAAEETRGLVEGTQWSTPAQAEAARKMLAWTGHCSHPVGLAVHDVGDYLDRPFESGLVFSLDPSLWVPEEHLYIRVEDTGVVTESGFESFTASAPLDLDAVEALVGRNS